MARFIVKMWNRRDLPWAGKITLLANTPEERQALLIFKRHVGLTQTGSRLDIVYPWRERGRRPDGAEQD